MRAGDRNTGCMDACGHAVRDARAASQKTRAAAEAILRTALVVRWQNARNRPINGPPFLLPTTS